MGTKAGKKNWVGWLVIAAAWTVFAVNAIAKPAAPVSDDDVGELRYRTLDRMITSFAAEARQGR